MKLLWSLKCIGNLFFFFCDNLDVASTELHIGCIDLILLSLYLLASYFYCSNITNDIESRLFEIAI